jgi:predicted esterase
MIERSIETNTHGRYLVVPPASAEPACLLVGFHGYGEGAEAQLERLRAIPGSDRWSLVAIQGLHRFYERRSNRVIASWMTRQDREHAIADNLSYVERVLDAVSREWPDSAFARHSEDDLRVDKTRLVLAGFSQGVAMAFRAACTTPRHVDAVIAVGGDVPPDDAASLKKIGTALICRGARDEYYSEEKFQHDLARIRQAGAAVQPLPFEGGHEWHSSVIDAAATFLDAIRLKPVAARSDA